MDSENGKHLKGITIKANGLTIDKMEKVYLNIH
jgi:hypothetical protein